MPVIAQIGRDVTQDFEESRERRLQKDVAFHSILRVQKKGMDWDESQQTYQSWNGDSYDTEMLAVGYKGPLWAVDYFLHLNLDKDVRILDVCCGTGLVARYLQQHGYNNIEALDASEAMLDKARKKNLYRAYHCCPIGDGNKAPIESEQFDVVTVAGGFAEGHMKPDAFDEMLRLLKVGGHVINVMRDENRRKVKIYANSFDSHCAKLVKEGRWRRVYEHVNPNYYMNLHGLVQVYQKTAKREAIRHIQEVQKANISFEASQKMYDSWHGSDYESQMLSLDYREPEWIVDYFLQLELDDDVVVLDVACGSGLVGKSLRRRAVNRFSAVDGLDSSKPMVEDVKKAGVYRKAFHCAVGKEHPPMPVADESYDVVTVAGGFYEGHLRPDALDDMLRVLKKGGFIINYTRYRDEPYLHNFRAKCKEMEESGIWTKVFEHITERASRGSPGLIQVFRKPDPANPWRPTKKQTDNWEAIMSVQVKGMSYDQAQGQYEKWHGNDYDTQMLNVGYKAPEWVVDYFLKLDLEPKARILDVAAGTGLVAKFLKERSKGRYTNIDALDASKEMLDGAKKLNIYKHFHHCMIGGGHKAPLEGDQFDVVTVAGGFAEAHMEVDAFDEMLRLLKVGGYIINVMREENRHKCGIYAGKFDAHCRKLVEEKKWELVYEHVTHHYYMDYHGLVQVYRKTAGVSPREAYERIMKVQSPGTTWRQSQELYLGWNGIAYEAHKLTAGYRGAAWAAEYLAGLGLDEWSRILDVCAGTGLVAKELAKRGYNNVEALDSSKEMIKGSVDRGYKKFHILTIGCDDLIHSIGMGVFDAITIAGGFAEGHLHPSAFRQLLQLVRPGGIIINVMRERDRRDVAAYRDSYDRMVQRLTSEGRWDLVYDHINANYIMEEDGLLQVWRVRERAHLESGCWSGNAFVDGDLETQKALEEEER